jgi:hypothetical protein
MTRNIELWMLGIALFTVLILVIRFKEQWTVGYKKRSKKKELKRRLDTLSPSEAEGYALLIEEGTVPRDEVAFPLEQKPSLIERDYTKGWRIADEYYKDHEDFLKKWAKQHRSRN